MKSIKFLAAMALALSWSLPAMADGALALGVPSDVSKGGVAIGIAWNEASPQAAQSVALKWCRDADSVPRSTLDRCRVVHNFSRQCVSIAVDPQPGTRGFGWGKGFTTTQSRYEALQGCRETAGNRASACTVIDSTCDTGTTR